MKRRSDGAVTRAAARAPHPSKTAQLLVRGQRNSRAGEARFSLVLISSRRPAPSPVEWGATDGRCEQDRSRSFICCQSQIALGAQPKGAQPRLWELDPRPESSLCFLNPRGLICNCRAKDRHSSRLSYSGSRMTICRCNRQEKESADAQATSAPKPPALRNHM